MQRYRSELGRIGMSAHYTWLRAQLESWVTAGIVSRDQAHRINSLYPEPTQRRAWGTLVFSGFGAAIFGLGVILLLAYNWAAMPKEAKLAVIFVGMASAHGLGLWLHTRGSGSRLLSEALLLLGSMLFGAGIWLIAQIYHIDEHYPSGFFIWGLGTLTLAWLLPSVAHGLLAATLWTTWLCCEGIHYHDCGWWGPPLLLISTASLAWRLRSKALLLATLLGFIFSIQAMVADARSFPMILMNLALAMFWIATGSIAKQARCFAASSRVFTALGWTFFIPLSFILSFEDVVGRIRDGVAEGSIDFAYFVVVLISALAVSFVAVVRHYIRGGSWPHENWVALVAVVFVVPAPLWAWPAGIFVFFNVVLLGLAGALMVRGCQQGALHLTVKGSLLLVGLASVRYFDLFTSLAARGVAFAVVGAVLFGVGTVFTYVRRRRHTEALS